MLNTKNNKNEKGFALIVSLALLLVMTLMGTILVINANNQSKVAGVSESEKQSFLSAESSTQKAMRYLETQIAANNYPLNGASTASTLCGWPISSAPITYAYKLNAMQDITTETGLTGANASRFSNEKFDYILRHIDNATSGGNSGAGSDIGMSANYSAVSSTTVYRYKIYACGTSPGMNADNELKTITEVIVAVNL